MDAGLAAVIAGLGSATVTGAATVTQSLRSQAQQLKHDREVREMHDLRDALDEALTAARKRYGVTRDLERRLLFGDRAKEELAETQPLIPIARAKLLVRLGRDHPVSETYNSVRHGFNDLVELIAKPLSVHEPPSERLDQCRARSEVARRAIDRFIDEAGRLAAIDPAVLAAAQSSRSSSADAT